MKVIEFNDVCFGYDKDEKKYILNHLSFSIPQGQSVSLIGKNGCGKSTIAKLIVGLLKQTSGKIKLFEEEKSCNKKIGYVFQNPDNQFIGNTVKDDIAFGLENRKIPQKEMDPIIDKVLVQVSMETFKNYEPSNLSGGQKQRVAIASNLALGLDIIIFDESTSMLDPKGRYEVLEIIKKLKKENPLLTIIQITHDMEETLLSDRILILDKGTIRFDGSPNFLFSNDKYVEMFNVERPFKYELISSLKKLGFAVNFDDSYEKIRSEINANRG